MNPDRLRRVNALFDAALDLPEAERAFFLGRECNADPTLRAELERLLARERQLQAASTQSAVGVFAEGIAAAAAAADQGQQFGPYRLEDEIGRGGMGRVFRARRTDGVIEQEVAIKLIRRELLHPALLKRFSTERQVLAALDHPGISRLIDAGETADGTPYVVMELVRGEPLLEYCDRRRLTIAQRLALFRRVLDAVAHAHRNLVVHRDLKPGNVLVTEDGKPKLLDFGIAKALQSTDGATATADRFFTPAFAAPEQLRGGAITVGCDVYALGVLLYEVLTGRLPFLTDNLSPGEIERLIVSVPPPAMAGVVTHGDPESALQRGVHDTRQLRRHLGGDLESIVQRALRKEPDARYATVEQFDADLAAYLERRPVVASGAQKGYRLRKFVQRHRLAVSLASLTAISLVGGAALLAAQNLALVRERDRAQFALEFLKDAFASADPGRAAGGNVSARQILDSAQARIDTTLADRPELRVELAGTIAEVQLAMGLFPQSAELAERAVMTARASNVAADQLRHLLIIQAMALSQANRLKEAEALLVEASNLGAGDSDEWRLAKGQVLSQWNRPREAIPFLERSVASLRDRPPSDELATKVRWQLADAFRIGRDFENSLSILDSTLSWQRAGLAKDHPRTLLTRLRRCDVLRRLTRNEESLTESESIVTDVEALYGVNSAFAANARLAFGSALYVNDRVPEAAEQYRKSLDAWRQSVGDQHQSTIRTRFNLAVALSSAPERQEEAGREFLEAMRTAAVAFGPTSETVVYFRLSYADFLLNGGRSLEALHVLAEAEGMDGLRATQGENRDEYLAVLRKAFAAGGCAVAGAVGTVPADKARESRDCDAARPWVEEASRPR